MQITPACTGCFAGLSCQVRIQIINLLQENDSLNVSEISTYFTLTQPTITHHLQYLQQVGILTSIKKGRQVYYSLHPKCGLTNCQIFTK